MLVAGYYGYMALYAGSQNANAGAYYLTQNEALNLKWETGESFLGLLLKDACSTV